MLNFQENIFMEQEQQTTKEEFRVSGDVVIQKIKELIHAGNVRRIILKNEKGETLIEWAWCCCQSGPRLAPLPRLLQI
jgi:hypothetical protein